MAAPKWATDLTEAVVERERLNGKLIIDPRLVWRRGSGVQSSGHCAYSGRLVVTAGSDRKDARLILLHELAHYLTGSRLGRGTLRVHHGDDFYRTLFDLVRWDARLTWKVVLTREGRYKAQAIATAKAMGIRGAGTIGKETRRRRIEWAGPRRPRGWCPLPLGKCWTNRTKRHTHYVGMVLLVDGLRWEVTEKVRPPWAERSAAGGGR